MEKKELNNEELRRALEIMYHNTKERKTLLKVNLFLLVLFTFTNIFILFSIFK
jgi:hypothetical protein